MKTTTHKFSLIEIGTGQSPIFGERMGNSYYLYGNKNNYPDYLIELFNSNPSHQAIITGKAKMIMGKGFQMDERLSPDQKKIVEDIIFRTNKNGEDIEEVMGKLLLDKLIFGGCSSYVGLEPIKKKFRHLYHVAYGNLRKKVNHSGFIFSQFWGYDKYGRQTTAGYLPRERKDYDAFDFEQKISGIYYYSSYSPGLRIYPKPEYSGAIPAIESDIEISRFHMNNVKTGFAAGHVVEVIGAASEEEQEEFEDQFKEKYTGSLAAGEVVIIHSPREDMGIKIHPMRPNDLDKQYIETAKKVQQDIFIGHRVTSPFIFGVKTEGQLGGREEMTDAMNEFQAKYVEPEQRWVCKYINDLIFQSYGFDPLLKIIPLDTGKSVENGTQHVQGDDKITLSASSEAEIITGLSNCGQNRDMFEVVKSIDLDPEMLIIDHEFETQLLKDVAEMKLAASGFDLLVMEYMKNNKGLTMQSLASRLGINVFLLQRTLTQLAENNLLQWRIGKDGQIIADKFSPFNNASEVATRQLGSTGVLETRYSYEGPQDEKTRAFCNAIINLNKMWKRNEIDALSRELGYDVWKSCGGWYTIPNSGNPPIRRPKCRHIWKANVVKIR